MNITTEDIPEKNLEVGELELKILANKYQDELRKIYMQPRDEFFN